MIDDVTAKRVGSIRFPVAGITACDNCWIELDDFFSKIHADSDVIYIVNTPDVLSTLLKHLAGATALPVKIYDDSGLVPNTIYVLPKHERQDIFFKDLAAKYTDFTIAVCINDQNNYTTDGFKAIKDNGGITFSSVAAHTLDEDLLDVTDFISKVRFIPKQLQLLSSRFEKAKLLQQTKSQIFESEERFKIVADTAPVLIWLSGIDGLCFFFNKGWLDFTGRTMEQESGDGWAVGVHPEDRERCLNTYYTHFKNKTAFNMEYRLRHHSGEYRWISDKVIPRFTAEGDFLGYVGGCMDIHEQKAMHNILEEKVALRTSEINIQKNELQQEKEFSEKVFNATVDFMLVCDRELHFLAFNNSFKKIYNVTDDDLGKSLFDIYPQAKNSPGHLDVLRAIEGETIHSEVYKSPITFNYYNLYYIPIQLGESVLIVGHDITDRIKTERKLEELNKQLQLQNTIFGHAEENALLGSYYWNITTGEMKYSDNLYRIMGFEPGAFVPNFESFLDTIHPDDKDEVIRNGALTVEHQKLHENKYRIMTPDGQIKFCRSTGNFIGSDGELSLIGTVQDISVDVKLNEILQKQNIELQNSNEDLASFNYIASHDLQEPLRKIHMFSSRILEHDSANFSIQSVGYFERIESAISRMQNLIQALLNYSSTNPADIKVSKTDLNSILAEVQINLEEDIAEKNVIIESTQLPSIAVIPLQFQQLLLNLISNAIKYSRPNEIPIIKITSERVIPHDRDGSEYFKIAFTDNGIGFDQRYEHKIFDLFQRLHGKSEYAGTGVGLAICKKIVQNHNGFITAEGTPGQGSTFTIYIPAKN